MRALYISIKNLHVKFYKSRIYKKRISEFSRQSVENAYHNLQMRVSVLNGITLWRRPLAHTGFYRKATGRVFAIKIYVFVWGRLAKLLNKVKTTL